MLIVGLLATSSLRANNIVVNGSFETGTFNDNGFGQDTAQLGIGNTDMANWKVVNNEVAWIGPANPFGLTASPGNYFLDLTSYSDGGGNYGGVSQVLPTVGGQTYHVSFDIGSSDPYNFGIAPKISVFANSIPLGTLAGASSGVNIWKTVGLDFVATGSSTTLDLIGSNSEQFYYIGLDNVQVSHVPDGGSTSALLGIGMLGVGLLRRKLLHA